MIETRGDGPGMSRPQRGRAGAAAIVALALVAGAVSSCGDSSPTSTRDADIYAAIVRALVPPEDDETKVTREVYVGSGADGVSLDVQADVVQELDEYERIRFVDEQAEAVDDEPPMAVHNGGVYLELGDIPERGTTVRVDARRYVSEDDDERLTVTVERAGGTWGVADVVPAA